MRYESVYEFIKGRLQQDLDPFLVYHDIEHTNEVIGACEHIGAQEGITSHEMVLLKTAALFHDTGFIRGNKDHEEFSCELATKYLPEYGYEDEDIATICRAIMATRVPQTPLDQLGKILCDADLSYLGTDTYDEKADRLFRELKHFKLVETEMEWELRQVDFISSHCYFTGTAKKELTEKKLANLADLTNALESVLRAPKGNRYMQIAGDTLLMLVGVIIAGCALKFFMVPNHFFDGGVTGLALLIHELYHINLAIAIVAVNMPLMIASIFVAGRKFALKTFVSVVLLGIVLYLLPDLALTSDKLLISIFGGVFLGIGIGLTMRMGAALDGIEVLALYTLKRTSFTITEIIMGLNILIFAIAAFSFGIETALYSILTYFAATRSIDYIVDGLQAYTGVTIISSKSEMIKYRLVNKLGRGITVYKGERGFLPGKFNISSECDIIFTVITRLELRKLRNLVHELDPKAFIFANTIKEASGGIIKRKHDH